ncbi:MAG: thioesterase, partial [Candidatus Goldbacteria bacterium]|nr:thioesterase [Candidatus Goldiibacteriota bacterium]
HYNEFEKQNGKILSDNLIWAITKLKLNMTRMPNWQENIKVKTWAPFVDKYFAYRNFEIMDEKDNIIGKSTFNWVIIDVLNKKTVIPTEFSDRWQFHKTPLFFELKGKIERITTPEKSREITVSYLDIDVNNHVNNVRYIHWIIDCIDFKILKEKVIKDIEVNFLAEAVINDRLDINIQKFNNSALYLGNVIRKEDNRELCRAKILFG